MLGFHLVGTLDPWCVRKRPIASLMSLFKGSVGFSAQSSLRAAALFLRRAVCQVGDPRTVMPSNKQRPRARNMARRPVGGQRLPFWFTTRS